MEVELETYDSVSSVAELRIVSSIDGDKEDIEEQLKIAVKTELGLPESAEVILIVDGDLIQATVLSKKKQNTNADKNKNTFRNEEQRQDVATVGNTTTTTVETTTTTTTISTEPTCPMPVEPTCPMPVEPTCPIPAEPSCPMPESVSTTAAVVTHEDCISKQIPNVKILDIATKNEFYLHDIIYNYKISILGMYSCKF